MDFKTFAMNMYPYWILGVIVMGLVIAAGQKQLLRVDKGAMLKWVRFLLIITVYRYILAKLVGFNGIGDASKAASMIPIMATLTVFWEDACHGLPLLLMQKLIGVSKWTKPLHAVLMGLVMVEFGLGHIYQGILPAVLLSFYIPYSVKKGAQFGFGTIMLGHILYDLVTLLSVKYLF